MRWRGARLPHREDGAHLPTQPLERTGGLRSCTTVCDIGRKERSVSCTTGQESATRPDDYQSLCSGANSSPVHCRGAGTSRPGDMAPEELSCKVGSIQPAVVRL